MTSRRIELARAAAAAGALALAGATIATTTLAAPATTPAMAVPVPMLVPLLVPCTAQSPAPEPPREPGAYYAIALVPTGRVPGTATSKGTARVTFADSPFGVAVSPAGAYEQALEIQTDALPARPGQEYVVWAASSDLDHVTRLGTIDGRAPLHVTTALNKFLVVVSLESAADAPTEKWRGPIVMRGMSRSGLMHTLAGHGPFQLESCLKYGYGGRP
ncbi:MAG: hypothetical protein R2752_14195 [Vicinamibacterales bacterium]